MQRFGFASCTGFIERIGKVFGGSGVVTEAVDYTAGAVVFKVLRLGSDEFIQYRGRGRLCELTFWERVRKVKCMEKLVEYTPRAHFLVEEMEIFCIHVTRVCT